MFSTITFYWGSDKNLHTYLEETRKYTDDIVIGYIDLFGYVPKIDGLKIISFSHQYMLDHGHSAILNELDAKCKYDWVFHAAVGKRITRLDKDKLLNAPANIAGYGSTEKGLGGSWTNLHNKEKAFWYKDVHEVIVPKYNFILSPEVAIEWERRDYVYDSEEQERICKMYRQMTRTKWVVFENNSPHPGRNVAIDMYGKHLDAYSMDRESLYKYMLENDLSAGM